MRRELGRLGIKHLKVVFSEEEPAETTQPETPPPGRRSVPASVPWVPSVAGLMLGGLLLINRLLLLQYEHILHNAQLIFLKHS
jgi:hypothetical protein